MRIKIKPLSVNEAWAGRRFKTPKYKAYEEELLWKLKTCEIPEGDLKIWFVFGTSSKLSDTDNFLKSTIDVLQKKYNFNDNRIFRIVADKQITKKGEEFIAFQIKHIDDNFEAL